jgi:hypothetical protein
MHLRQRLFLVSSEDLYHSKITEVEGEPKLLSTYSDVRVLKGGYGNLMKMKRAAGPRESRRERLAPELDIPSPPFVVSSWPARIGPL